MENLSFYHSIYDKIVENIKETVIMLSQYYFIPAFKNYFNMLLPYFSKYVGNAINLKTKAHSI